MNGENRCSRQMSISEFCAENVCCAERTPCSSRITNVKGKKKISQEGRSQKKIGFTKQCRVILYRGKKPFNEGA